MRQIKLVIKYFSIIASFSVAFGGVYLIQLYLFRMVSILFNRIIENHYLYFLILAITTLIIILKYFKFYLPDHLK